jgi:NAD+ diphosphatase
LNNRAFFLQGGALLLPEDFPDSQADMGLPQELAENFDNPDIFEIPAIGGVPPFSQICAVSVPPNAVLPANWRSVPVRQILGVLDGDHADGAQRAGGILRACHIAQWRRDSVFCGTCGAKNNDVQKDVQRKCPVCGREEFPRICPAIIVVITDGKDRILLAHNKRFKSGIYSHISGFNEAGETLEETVVRETREEVNIEVEGIEYLKSQPWPFPNSLMVGFKAKYLSGTIQPDGVEIEDAQWFSRDNLPQLPGQGSLSRLLIGRWIEGTL